MHVQIYFEEFISHHKRLIITTSRICLKQKKHKAGCPLARIGTGCTGETEVLEVLGLPGVQELLGLKPELWLTRVLGLLGLLQVLELMEVLDTRSTAGTRYRDEIPILHHAICDKVLNAFMFSITLKRDFVRIKLCF